MSKSKKIVRLAAMAATLVWLAPGCVRLSEPDSFICERDGDCASDEKCSAFRCVAKDHCIYDGDCGVRQRCELQRCVAAECTYDTQESDCNGAACRGGLCSVKCYFEGDCVAGYRCEGGACQKREPSANGASCSSSIDCVSGSCCSRPSGDVCADSCNTLGLAGDACQTSADCASSYCCPGTSGSKCSSVVCPQSGCTSSLDCELGKVCVSQKCQTPTQAKATGEACVEPAECKSLACVAGKCRGTGTAGKACSLDIDCEAGRSCCKQLLNTSQLSCGELNRGCPGTIGDSCEFDFDCLDGDCNGSFCTKPCTSNDQCGKSPWGVANACETNGVGNRICFPGCTTTAQCTDNLDFTFTCYDAFDSVAKLCAAQ
jgi:hypothetical protein